MKTARKKMMVLVGVLAVSLLGMSNTALGAYSQSLWTENFDGYSAGDLPTQDATWVRTERSSPTDSVTDVDTSQFESSPNSLKVRSQASIKGVTTFTQATKTLGVSATNDLVSVEFEYQYRTNPAGGSGILADVFLMDSTAQTWNTGTPFVQLTWRDSGTTVDGTLRINGNNLGGGTVPLPYTDFHAYELLLDFGADQVELKVDGVSKGTYDFLNLHDPGDFTKVGFRVGQNYAKAAKTGETYVDDIVVSQVPEPVTLTLLLTGVLLAGVRRRR